MRLWQDDLRAMHDREARKRGAIAVLEDLGYTVQLTVLQTQPSKNTRHRRPTLVAVAKADPDDDRPASNSTPVADP